MRALYNITFTNRDGLRTIFGHAQARYMHDTREAAERHLADIMRNSGEPRLLDICGQQARGSFRVDAFECWDHGDPKGIYV